MTNAVTLANIGSSGGVQLPTWTTGTRPATPVNGLTGINTTTGFPEWYSSAQSAWIQTNATAASYSIDYLVVAGGGSGGDGTGGGGGGAGGYLGTSATISPGVSYPVIIGAGGAPTQPNTNQTGNPGSNTIFAGIATAIGGGQGGCEHSTTTQRAGKSGGSGGGAGRGTTGGTGGSGTTGQGNAGGSASDSSGSYYLGGGGGGAGAAGANASGNQAGAGGAGLNAWALGTYYAGGGGGSVQAAGGGLAGAGGAGGGGAGSQDNSNGSGGGTATSGTANTGGGGGGGPDGYYAGSGGSGVVIIRYSGTPKAGGGTITQSGGYTYHTFTSSGSLIG